ncbi:hypothetical protein BH24CHL9_BH24CHL9_06540 [soil metagenome]
MPLGELGQLAVVVRGQVIADLAKLLVHDVEVVDEPFGGRRDEALFLDGTGERPVGLQEDAPVLGHARRNRPSAARPIGRHLGDREGAGVLLQALDAEELGDDGVLELARPTDGPAQAASQLLSAGDRSHARRPAEGRVASGLMVLGTGRS